MVMSPMWEAQLTELQTRIHSNGPLGQLPRLISGKLEVVDIVKILRQVPASKVGPSGWDSAEQIDGLPDLLYIVGQ